MTIQSGAWVTAIERVSDRFKNAKVSLIDPSLVTTTYDPVTNTETTTGDPVVVADVPARVQPFRVSNDLSANGTGNPSGEIRIRVQLPRESYTGRIQRGWQVRITEATRTPDLETYIFYVDSVVNSSWRASITMECTANLDNILAVE